MTAWLIALAWLGLLALLERYAILRQRGDVEEHNRWMERQRAADASAQRTTELVRETNRLNIAGQVEAVRQLRAEEGSQDEPWKR